MKSTAERPAAPIFFHLTHAVQDKKSRGVKLFTTVCNNFRVRYPSHEPHYQKQRVARIVEE